MEQAEAREQYEELKAEEALADEFAWQAKGDAEIAEAEAREAATAVSAAEDQQRWDDWALASELGMASPRKRELGSVPVGQPLRLTLALAVDTMPFRSGSASSTDRARLSGEQLIPFLESNLGAIIFEWWSSGLVPSILVKQELGADVLEAIQAQKSFLDSHTGEKQA